MHSQPEMIREMTKQIKHNFCHLAALIDMLIAERSTYDFWVQINAMLGNAHRLHTMFTQILYVAMQAKTNALLTTPFLDEDTMRKLLEINKLAAGMDTKELVKKNIFLDELINNKP